MFHPQNPSDPTSTAMAQAAPPSPTPRFKTPELQLPDNFPHPSGNLPQLPGNSPHLPGPHPPDHPSGLAPPASPVPVVPVDQKKGSRNRLKLPKLRKTPKAKVPAVDAPAKLRKRTRVKLALTKIKARLGLGVKVPSTKGVTSAAQVPLEAPAAVPASPRL